MALSDLALRQAKPANRTQHQFDGGGLDLEIYLAGGKWWRLKYRIAGKEKRLSLGTYPDVELNPARAMRDEARKLIAPGIALSGQRKQEELAEAAVATATGDTFEVLARQWMARQAVARVTADKSRWLLETFLFPKIGSRPTDDITPRELLDALRKNRSPRQARNRQPGQNQGGTGISICHA